MLHRTPGMLTLVLVIMLAGCAPSADAPRGSADRATQAAAPTAPTRVAAVLRGDPPALRALINTAGGGGGTPGVEVIEELLNVGLATFDNQNRLQARLAQELATVENGLWRVFPDGRMEMTWKIRPNVRWHDGSPFTAEDIVFTAQVLLDPELPNFREPLLKSLESAVALDSHTVLLKWNEPFIHADQAFSSASPSTSMPRHLLGNTYATERTRLAELPYWSTEFVGTGPYKLREFERGSYLTLQANDDFAFGRPKIDEIEIKLVGDANVLVANVLAGTAELPIGGGAGISLDQALQIRNVWTSGRVETYTSNSWMAAYPQFIDPRPAVLGDVRLRRALMHAVDRQELIETLVGGFGTVAHSIRISDEPEFRGLETEIVRYEYDPRKARSLVEELGYATGEDGALRDRSGQSLSLEVRHTVFDLETKSATTVADYWRRTGLAPELAPISPQRATDREYRATYPAIELLGQSGILEALTNLRYDDTALAENNYVGKNRARYRNRELDGLIADYFKTIPRSERARVVGRIVHHMTDQVIWMGFFHQIRPTLIPSRVQKLAPRGANGTEAWNAHEWEIVGARS